MEFGMKPHWLAVLAASAAVTVSAPQSRATLADLHGLTPREVKTEAFSLASPQDVQIEATGAEPSATRGTVAKIRAMWNGEGRANPWPGNAWILDLTTRKVVWELSKASTTPGSRSARLFNGTVRLPGGSYAAYYSAFPDGEYWTNDDGKAQSRKWHWFGDERIDDFKLIVRGDGQRLAAADVERLRQAADASAVVALHAGSGELFQQAGFSLSKPTDIEIRAEGEAREDGEFDYGWIINADTRAKVWRLTWRDSAPAGGADKNRMVALTQTLLPGRYAVFYATDDTHDPSEWNAPPPHDPDAWGLTIAVKDAAARAAVSRFTYEHVPERATILALTRIGNGESRKQGFTLARPMDVRIYALGEGRNGQMFDYGWITSAASRKRVWEMRYDDTEGAGGDPKNRLVDTTVRLDKGSYIVALHLGRLALGRGMERLGPARRPSMGHHRPGDTGHARSRRRRPLRRQGRSVDPRAAHRSARRRPGPQALHARIATATSASTRSAKAAAATCTTTDGSRTRRPAAVCGK